MRQRFMRPVILLILVSVGSGLFLQPAFAVSTTANLVTTVTPSSLVVLANSEVTYTIGVTNLGPDVAEQTAIVDALPADVILKSVDPGATVANGNVTWPTAHIDPGETVTRQLVIEPIHPGPVVDVVKVRTSSLDPVLPNFARATTTVLAEPGVEYFAVRNSEMRPRFHLVPLGTTVQWNFFGSATDVHEITDVHGLGLIDTGGISPVSFSRQTFDLSGEFRTADAGRPDNAGKIVVPLEVAPSIGTSSTSFRITLALSPLPNGLVTDVQIRRPGASRWSRWRHGTSLLSAVFRPHAGPGTYLFRDRVRDPGSRVHSRFGPPVPLTVLI